MIKNLIARLTGQTASTELARLNPMSDLARELREAPIQPMTADEFRTYVRERATGRAAYQLRQDGRI